jgi:Barrier to autointegration factor
VPGIGPAAARALEEAGVDTTYALFGKFLSMKTKDCGPIEHSERFFQWLVATLPRHSQFRSGIVQAVAEKLNISFPGVYDPDAYSPR